ncbi:hypothetical protein C8Q75DRAFT_732281 [Abortiporus biennis]|nr:hypothetical protein C8Q75DRAFT_732281 [Abortiporus biennis]
MLFTTILGLVSLSFIPLASSIAIPDEMYCREPVVVSTSYVGQNKNVKMEVLQCDTIDPHIIADSLVKRQTSTNVCGATCNTNCFAPSGGGPNPNDCNVIENALRYDAQNIGNQFQVRSANNTGAIAMTYATCKTFIDNLVGGNLTYCRNDWATVLHWVAWNCQATQNAHGGNCFAVDQRWLIQVNTA